MCLFIYLFISPFPSILSFNKYLFILYTRFHIYVYTVHMYSVGIDKFKRHLLGINYLQDNIEVSVRCTAE